MNATLGEIETQAKKYSDTTNQLTDVVNAMETEITAVKKKYLEKILPLAEKVSLEKAILHEAITSAPNLFEKPRTFSFHGIKVGYQKKKGRIEIIDEEKTIELIEKKLEDKADNIILLTKSVIKRPLGLFLIPLIDRKSIFNIIGNIISHINTAIGPFT